MHEIAVKYRLALVKEESYTYDDLKLSSPEVVVRHMNDVFGLTELPEEQFVIMCLDTKNQVAGMFVVSHGSLGMSIVHPREVFKRALLCNAASIICAHNHPSGMTEPSKEDIVVTKRLRDAGELLGIPMIDHIIVGRGCRYYSFKEDNQL